MSENQQQNEATGLAAEEATVKAATEAAAAAAAKAEEETKAKAAAKQHPVSRKLKISTSCGASGINLAAGKTYKVPDDVSEADAKVLVRMGRGKFIK